MPLLLSSSRSNKSRMRKQTGKECLSTAKILAVPAFPWSGRGFFKDVRAQLAREHNTPVTYAAFAEIMGCPKTTAFRWSEEVDHKNIVALFACLERLSATARQEFIEAHCRVLPELEHPWLSHWPASIGKLRELLSKERGLSVIAGRQSSRTFLFHAFGHAYRRLHGKNRRATGLDLHRPNRVVPLEFCTYVEGAALAQIRCAVVTLWPRIVTTSARMVMLNGVWLIQELREDILRLAERTHVVLACAGIPEIRSLALKVQTPIHLVTVSESKLVEQGICLNVRQLRKANSSTKTG